MSWDKMGLWGTSHVSAGDLDRHPRVVVLGESHLRLLVQEYVEHYHGERNHQGLDNQLLSRAPPPAHTGAGVQRRQRIGGLLSYYHREAA